LLTWQHICKCQSPMAVGKHLICCNFLTTYGHWGLLDRTSSSIPSLQYLGVSWTNFTTRVCLTCHMIESVEIHIQSRDDLKLQTNAGMKVLKGKWTLRISYSPFMIYLCNHFFCRCLAYFQIQYVVWIKKRLWHSLTFIF